MASIEHRSSNAGEYWRVVWRQDGEKQREKFPALDLAQDFLIDVERQGGWPRGWTPGKGYDAEDDAMPRFAGYAERTIASRAKADPGTKATYRRMLANHVTPVIGTLPLASISRHDVARIGAVMADKGLSQKTLSNVHALVSSVLSDAVRDRYLDRNPAEGAMPRIATSRTEEMCFLTHGEFGGLARHLEAGGDEQGLGRFLVGTGLRWSEATALQVWDVDLLGRKALDVRRAWKRRGALWELGNPKTVRSRRSVPLSAEVREVLIPLVASKQPGDFVFNAPDGGEVRHANWYHRVWRPALLAARYCDTHRSAALDAERAWKNAKRVAARHRRPFDTPSPVLAGCGCAGTLTKDPRIHDLRHTHASWLIDEKVSLPAIQRQLGHESITTTIDRYGHLAPEHVDEITAAVDRALARR